MDWLEFSVSTDGEAAEAIGELFNRYGRGGAVFETPIDCFEHELGSASAHSEVIVKTYLPADGANSASRRQLEEGLWHLGQLYPIPQPTIRTLAEEDWANAWRKQYHAIRVGRRILIVPAWEDQAPLPGDLVIRLEPGMAFGTGLHPTTRLCLAAMEEQVTEGCAVLDVGTGSGVLAIAAAKLGAGTVLALDADPVAVRVARENVEGNGVSETVAVVHGSLAGSESGGLLPHRFGGDGMLALPVLEEGRFELVTVNILAHVIVGMAPVLALHLAPGGRIIAAGIVDKQEIEVVDALHAAGLRVADRALEKDWVCLVVRQA
ncbi:50S ribosomal protein L11 methyltransferase [Chloroflexota bacterium]